jgi:hypothetical protein
VKTANRHRPAAGEVPILNHDPESEVADVDDQGCADQVPVDGVALGTLACLNFEHDSLLVMDRINLVDHAWSTLFSEQYGPSDLLSGSLAGLDDVSKIGQDRVQRVTYLTWRPMLPWWFPRFNENVQQPLVGKTKPVPHSESG